MQTTTTAPTILITKATTYAIITSLNSSTGHNKRPTIIIYPTSKYLFYTWPFSEGKFLINLNNKSRRNKNVFATFMSLFVFLVSRDFKSYNSERSFIFMKRLKELTKFIHDDASVQTFDDSLKYERKHCRN